MIAALYLHSKQMSAQVERKHYACYRQSDVLNKELNETRQDVE